MIDIINLIAISNKGKSKIGSKLVTAIVEQVDDTRVFVVINGKDDKVSQCRWIQQQNDPDFRIIMQD